MSSVVICLGCCIVLCFRPTVFAVCMNQMVVVFQPWSGTAPDLVSVNNYTFYSNSPAPLVSIGFLDILISPLYPTAPPSVAVVVVDPLSCTSSPPPLPALSAVHLDFSCTRHPPASADHLFALRHMPEYSAVYRDCLPPPLPPLACSQVPART